MPDLTGSHLALARIIDALFCSELETGHLPTNRQLAAAIRAAVKTHRTWNGCTRAVAAAFTRNPLAAEQRELWCHQLAQDALKTADLQPDVDVPSY